MHSQPITLDYETSRNDREAWTSFQRRWAIYMLSVAYGSAPLAWLYGYIGICSTCLAYHGRWEINTISVPVLPTPWPDFFFVAMPEFMMLFMSAAVLGALSVLACARWTRWPAIFWAAPALMTSLGVILISFRMFDEASP